ncbi:MAG: HEPN domain-containing protein [Crenarchaeota archaeon]|nr:HEPN domain-containing protein [Thermoproteota archaeon]
MPRDEARRWLSEAKWDYETALILYKHSRWNAACFYAHQAAEKAVKALLYSINEAPWGHSIRVLLQHYFELTGEKAPRRQELLTHARELDRHYIPARYPNAHPPGTTPHEAYDEEAAKRALRAAKIIIQYVEERLEEESEDTERA